MSDFKIKSQQRNAILCKHLRALRTEQRLTMRALSDKLDTNHSFIGKIEHQNRRLDVGEFTEYCSALEVDPIQVLAKLIKIST